MIFSVPLRVYPFQVVVALGCDDEKVTRYIRRKNGAPLGDETVQTIKLEDRAGAKTVHFTDGDCLIRLRRFPVTPAGRSLLAHEISHAVEYVMWQIGCPHTHDSREPWAYLTEYLTREIYKEMERRKR